MGASDYGAGGVGASPPGGSPAGAPASPALRLHDRRLSWSAILLAAYGAVLVAIPADVGLRLPGFVLSPARALLFATLVVALLEIARDAPSRRLLPPRVVIVAWLAFLAAFAVSTVLNAPAGAFVRFGSLAIEGLLLWVLAWHVATRAGAERVATTIAAASVVVALASTVLALTGQRYDVIVRAIQGDAVAEAAPLRFGIVRQQAAFDAPLTYGIWLLAASALVVGQICQSQGRRRWLWIAGWVIVAAAAFTTVSRLVLVGLPLVVALDFSLRERWRRAAVGFLAAFVVAFVVFAVPAGVLSNVRIGSIDFDVDLGPPGTVFGLPFSTVEMTAIESSNEARIEAALAGLGAAAERPLFGWGPLTAKGIVSERLGHDNWVDNTYIAFLVEGGVVGLAAFVGLVLVVVGAALRNRGQPAGSARAVALLTMLGSAGFAAFFSLSQGYAAFWLIAGLATPTLLAAPAHRESGTAASSAVARGAPEVAQQVPHERGISDEVASP